MTRILVVCTANQCRSPLAEAVLNRRLEERGVAARAESAGLLSGGHPSPPEVVAAGERWGLDLSGHLSRTLDEVDADGADLIVGMAREHVREVVVASPPRFGRTFTLRELARRATAVGPRMAGEDLGAWLGRLHAGRRPADLLGESAEDDLADPMGGPPQAYADTVEAIVGLCYPLVSLAWPETLGPDGA